jgi:TPR repeat protein
MAQLGECYEFGRGVNRDASEALHWYERAFAEGFHHVQPAIDRVRQDLQT